MAQSILYKAGSRGVADHGWLKSYHTFSFGGYYNPERIHFGALRVINDDTVMGGMGFSEHPHDNMEIVSIPLEGALRHKDSMGNTATIRAGEIQVMSAGTGVRHSEHNAHAHEPVKFLQIWVFPDKQNVKPRYDQAFINRENIRNEFIQILGPEKQEGSVWIYQHAWFSLANFDAGTKRDYTLHDDKNGLYIFVLKGQVEVNGQLLEARDGYGIWDITTAGISASADSDFLLMEVPMLA